VFCLLSSEQVVEVHNKASERAVRQAVLKRKVSLGTQSEAGKRVWEAAWTVSQTCKLVGASISQMDAQAIAAFQNQLPAPVLV
jgi:hypothetical protein